VLGCEREMTDKKPEDKTAKEIVVDALKERGMKVFAGQDIKIATLPDGTTIRRPVPKPWPIAWEGKPIEFRVGDDAFLNSGNSNAREYFKTGSMADIYKDLVDQATSLDEVSEPVNDLWMPEVEANENNVKQDRFDHRAFENLLHASPELSSQVCDGPKQLPAWPELVNDVWASFYKMEPTLVDEKELAATGRPNRPVVQRLLEDPTTEQTRIATTLDEFGAAMATLATAQSIREQLAQQPDLAKALGNQQNQPQPAQNGPEGANAQQPGQQPGGDQLGAQARALRRMVRKAVEAGKDEVEKTQEALGGWGIDPAELEHLPLEQRLAAAKRLAGPKLRKLAERFGRMRNLARRRQADRLKTNPDELHSITLGGDLERVLPAELSALHHPLRRLDFYRRWQERGLLEYELQSRPADKHGPMVVLVDCSGSMSGANMDWALGLTVALLDTARRQKRACAVLPFNTEVTATYIFAPQGPRNLDDLARLASIGASGGTDYEKPLTKAMQIIGSESSTFKAADIVMVTDGECDVRPEFLLTLADAKKRTSARAWVVAINAHDVGPMKDWADKVWLLKTNDLDNDQGIAAAGDIFEEVVV